MAQTQQEARHRLYSELWTSFAALVRSYVAAHDLAKPISTHARVDESEDGRLTLRREQRMLDLEFDTESGAGRWAVYEDSERVLEQGSFRIGEDSQIVMSGGMEAMELGAAAEALTAKIFEE